ncbi:hypothetical protein F4677DRAFT_412380 [Hypoxylon crocopeplum]|nr:hypothetical protein F4677DRAFT_412380 [Hypoxylon crocopeplum]
MSGSNYVSGADLGLQMIHLLCLSGDFEDVVNLSRFAEINIDTLTEPQRSAEWRLRETPIKLAALMGHLDIVEFLLQRGAALAQDDGLHASTYADDKGLAVRRREFFLKTVQVCREHPDAVNTRKAIYSLLVSPGRRSVFSAMRGPRADLGFPDYKLAKQGRDIVVYAPVMRVRTDILLDRSKTIGVITAKGSGDVLMAAHSGFRLGGDRDEKCLDTNEWNYIALHHIAALIKFHFPGNRHDNGNKPVEDDMHRGRAHAGHVEVLLAAWYVLEMMRKISGNGREAPLDWLLAHLHVLKTATLGYARLAIIMIDSQPCATCLKFINRLFQYTGLHFSVKGGVGTGPTLATKDKRNNRFDTFGDTFPLSDGEEEEDDGDVDLLDVDAFGDQSLMIRDAAMDGVRVAADNNHAEGSGYGIRNEHTSITAHLSSNQHHREVTPPLTPEFTAAINGEATPTIAPAMQRTVPVTPARGHMQWPIPENRVRVGSGTTTDPFYDSPSRRPENHFDLLAEYKKKTPVYHFPGYEGVARFLHQSQQSPQQEQLGPALPLTRAGAGVESGTEEEGEGEEIEGEDVVLIDAGDDSGHDGVGDVDDVAVYSASNSSNATPQRQALESSSRMNDHSSMMSRATFSYSSFEPIASRENNLDAAMQSSDEAYADADADADVDEDGFYMIRSLLERRPRLNTQDLIDHHEQEQGQGQGQEMEERPDTPCPIPVPGMARLQQWRYDPRPQQQQQQQRPRAAATTSRLYRPQILEPTGNVNSIPPRPLRWRNMTLMPPRRE